MTRKELSKEDWLNTLEELIELRRGEFLSLASELIDSEIPAIPTYITQMANTGNLLIQNSMLYTKVMNIPEDKYLFLEDQNQLWVEVKREDGDEKPDYMV